MKNKIDLSVVILNYNTKDFLTQCLKSVLKVTKNGFSYQIIVVDNASTDDTPSIVKDKMKGFPVPLRYIHETNLGLHSGRNRGAAEASGRVVSFLDDDMVLDEHWIQGGRLVLDGQADMVGGRIFPLWESDAPDWVNAFISNYEGGKVLTYLGLIDLGDEVKAVDAYHVFGGNCFIPRDVVLELKGYHPDSLPAEIIRYRGDGQP